MGLHGRFAAVGLLCTALVACDPEVTAPYAVRPVVIAHRGASYAAPEHTTAAYDLALDQGADYIEQDIARTSDGVLVVIHDATLDRTFRGPAQNCAGSVASKTLAQLRTCSTGTWFNASFPQRASAAFDALRVLTLDEVFGRYRSRARYYVEIKDPALYSGIEAQLVNLLAAHGISGVDDDGRPRVFVQSFDAQALQRVRAIDPSIPLVLLTGNESSDQLRQRLPDISGYARGIGPPALFTSRSLVLDSHTKCLVVHPYTADDPQGIQSLLESGVDGLFTNRPDIAREVIDRSNAATNPSCAPLR